MAIHFLNADGSLKSIEYKGCVLKVNNNVRYEIMSDMWGASDDAIVWDKENNRPKTVSFRFCDYKWDTPSYAEVDATKAVKAAYRKHLIDRKYKELLERAENYAGEIVKDCTVEVVRGRKVPKGTKGKVVVTMMTETGFGWKRTTALKLGIATSDVMIDVVGKNGKMYKNYRDMVWVWAYNCKRTDVAKVDIKSIMADAIESVDHVLAA